MLYTLVTLLFLLPAVAGFGSLFEKHFGQLFQGLSARLFAGVLSLSVLWLVVSFFLPLNRYTETISLGVGFGSFFYFRTYEHFYGFLKTSRILFPAVLMGCVFFASFFPYITDHFGYYIPTIMWLKEVGLVRGISNLDLILGQMSLWHIFQAGFANFSDPFLRAGVLALVVYLIYIFEKKAWIHLCLIPVLFPFLQSPSPDLPVLAFSLIILNEIFTGNRNSPLLFASAVFVFALKPTALWLPVLVLFYYFPEFKKNLKSLLPGILLLGLFFMKNIWTFGYPVFPVQIGDMRFSWTPNVEILNNSTRLAVEKTYDLQYRYTQIRNFSWAEHIRNWLFITGIKSIINIALIVSMLFFTFFTVVSKRRIISCVYASLLLKVVLVLLFSAQYRFFIDVFFVIAFTVLYAKVSKVNALMIFALLSVILGAVFSSPSVLRTHVPSFRLGRSMGGFKFSQLYKPSVYRLEKYNTYRIGNLIFHVVTDYLYSFDTPVPAISPGFLQEYYDAGIFPQLRGKNVSDGFVWRQLTQKEKKYLQQILLYHNNQLKR